VAPRYSDVCLMVGLDDLVVPVAELEFESADSSLPSSYHFGANYDANGVIKFRGMKPL
jgi:hypothetical protein